jgi:hypothetical protein
MSDNNGGTAFPLPRHTRKYCEKTQDYIQDDGMTLRDYFAAKALQGLLPARDPQGRSAYTEMSAEECARSAYQMADAMLKAREVGNE